MKRRQFLKSGLCATALLGLSSGIAPRLASAAIGGGLPFKRTLINLMLLGGADLRFLFVPDPSTAYAVKFWEARQSLYQDTTANTTLYPTYNAVWNNLYLPVTISGVTFGVHKNAAWLRDQLLAGNASIVANVLGSNNRRHDHSQLIVNSGDTATSQFAIDRDGWGGRLAQSISGAYVVAVTEDISVYCNGTDPINRNANVVHAKDTRNFGLSDGNGVIDSSNTVLARSLKGYYAQKRLETVNQPSNWPFRKFLQHENDLRKFGGVFNERINIDSPIQPVSISNLYTALSGNTLRQPKFGKQCGNIYDSFVAADLFNMRVISTEYTGWDTHNNEMNRFDANIEDIFGTGKGLDTLTQALASIGANDSAVYTINSDFGRQLRANGSNGTDHGVGNYMILIGTGLTGGIYGEMFPNSEITGSAGSTRYDQQGTDIQGQTAFERVLAPVCDWVEPGTGSEVFPNTIANTLPIEPGVDLGSLFA
jgi:uncharacterized protein (DUF1501 family)